MVGHGAQGPMQGRCITENFWNVLQGRHAICVAYGSESWVLTDSLIHKLEAFHHGVARRITGTKASFCRVTSVWSAPPIEEVLEQASLFPMREYLKRRQTKTIAYVATRPIYHEATTTARRSGSSTRRKFWWTTLQRDD